MPTALAPDILVTPRLAPDLVAADRAVLCDLDGCLVSEGRALDGAAEFVEGCGERLWIVSNNSTHSAQGLSDEIERLGLSVPSERILLAGEQTLHHLMDTRRGQRVAVFASPALEAEARRLGLAAPGPLADIALLGRDTQLTLERLNALAALVRNGAEFWVTNTDRTHPGLSGGPIAETGALLAAVRAMLGQVPAQCIGKPHPHMAETILARLGLTTRDAVFVGDNSATDGAIAQRLGMRFIHLQRPGARA